MCRLKLHPPGHFEEGEEQLRMVCGLRAVQSELHSSWQQHSSVSMTKGDTKLKDHSFVWQLFNFSSLVIMGHKNKNVLNYLSLPMTSPSQVSV